METTYESRYPELAYECSLGWYELIDNCVDKMVKADPDVVFHQIKEKFAGLRIYYSTSGVADNLLEDYVAQAEDLAEKTCEFCGSTHKVSLKVRNFWYRTLCGECSTDEDITVID